MTTIPLVPLQMPMPAAPAPATNYVQMFRTIPDATTESPIGSAAPKVWGSVRLAAWSWAGIGDLGPVILDTGWPASYAAAANSSMGGARNILSI